MLLLLLIVVVGAGVLGITITVMEEGDFPEWWTLIICVLAALLPTMLINQYMPAQLFFVGPIVGAMCGGVAISATCDMTWQRASIAAGIYLVFQIGMSFLLVLMMKN